MSTITKWHHFLIGETFIIDETELTFKDHSQLEIKFQGETLSAFYTIYEESSQHFLSLSPSLLGEDVCLQLRFCMKSQL